MAYSSVPYPFTARHYAPRLPELRDGVDVQRHPVVVVGGGPVGYTTALGLARQGVRVVLLEADDSVCFGSRAICISRRSLEIAARLGALPGFLDVGLPWTGGRSYYRDTEVLHFQMPQDENQKLPPMLNLAQYHIEQILLNRAEELSHLIDIRWQTRVTGMKVDASGARLTLSTPLGDYAINADWLVAADGGRSTVRESLGLALQGTSYEGRYVIVDILLDSQRATERLAYFDPPCNPGSTVLVHKQPDGVWRIDYQLGDGEDPDQAVLPENVMPRVASLLEMMGERGAWQPIWTTIYKANALTLEHYRHGRVLFAGDAAHLVPIFGVRGANSGIDDADNLAWKLAFVVQGLASERLLDSYSQERVAATHENLAQGTKSTEFMAPPSFAFALMRTAVLGLALRHPRLRSLINPRQSVAICYTGSRLNTALPASAEFDAGPVPGAVLPECPLTHIDAGNARPGYLTDLLATGFTALYFSEAGTLPPVLLTAFQALMALPAHLAARGIPFELRLITKTQSTSDQPSAWDHTQRLFPLLAAKPGSLYLVRPDGHVLARWRQGDANEVLGAIDHALRA